MAAAAGWGRGRGKEGGGDGSNNENPCHIGKTLTARTRESGGEHYTGGGTGDRGVIMKTPATYFG